MERFVIVLSGITSISILLYWFLVWIKIFDVKEIIPGYRMWFKSFLVPDLWIAATSFITATLLLQNDQRANVFGLLTGSSLIFLGLYALAYGVTTGLIFRRTTENLIEIFIKLYCLIVGTFLIIYFY